MTAKDFIIWAENVYGEYRTMMKQEVLAVLSEWDQQSIYELRKETLREFDDKYRTPPGVHYISKSESDKHRHGAERDARILERTKQLAVGNEKPDVVEVGNPFDAIKRAVAGKAAI